MMIYRSLMEPVLLLGIPFQLFYGMVFIGFGLFMGTMNLVIPVVMVFIGIIVKSMTKQDTYFFEILKRNFRYPAVFD